MVDRVKKIVNSVYPISDNAFRKIEDLLEIEKFRKDENFIYRNRRNEKEYFVLKGITKSYLINPDGDEVTISFFSEDSILSPYSTRTSKGLSTFYYKALTDIQLASINAGVFENLMIEDLEIRTFANTVLQNELMLKVEKEIGLVTLTAKERLIEFRRKHRLLENLIPHRDIASYLGITNISLSRLRKDLTD